MQKLPEYSMIAAYFFIIPAVSRYGGNIFLNVLNEINNKIEFQVAPQTITDSKSANYSEQEILGRTEPIRAYSHSGTNQIGLEIDYYWYSNNPASIGSWGRIKTNVDKMKALVYPQYSTNFAAPPKVLFFFGDLYKGIPCIVKQVQVTYNPDGGTDNWVQTLGDLFPDPDFHPSHTRVSISLEASYDLSNVPGYDEAKGNVLRNLFRTGISFITSRIRSR